MNDQMVTFLLTGRETITAAIGMAFYLSCQYADVQEKLARELDVFFSGERNLADALSAALYDDAQLPYTKAVLAETMRLFPPAPFIERESLAADTILDWEIPAHQQLIISVWALHRHLRYWGESAECFQPERWLDADGRYNEKLAPVGCYLPFGLGKRRCIGEGPARPIMLTAFALGSYRLDINVATDKPLEISSRVALQIGGMSMRLRRRRSFVSA